MSKQAKKVMTTLSFEKMLQKVADTKYVAPKKESKDYSNKSQVIGLAVDQSKQEPREHK